jgi:hypothetical protein
VRDDSEEKYIYYAFLCQSGRQHVNLKVEFQNDFTTGDNHYPKNRQQTLNLLDNYSKTVVTRVTQSEVTPFAQRSGRGGGNIINCNRKIHEPSTYDKNYWKDKECYKCHKKGHPSMQFPKKPNGLGKDDDDRSLASTASSVLKMKKDLKSMKKAFAKVNTQLRLLKEADYDIFESEGDEEASHFQVEQALQFAQVDK